MGYKMTKTNILLLKPFIWLLALGTKDATPQQIIFRITLRRTSIARIDLQRETDIRCSYRVGGPLGIEPKKFHERKKRLKS